MSFETCKAALQEWLKLNRDTDESEGISLIGVIHGGRGPARGWTFSTYGRWFYHVLIDGSIERVPSSSLQAVSF